MANYILDSEASLNAKLRGDVSFDWKEARKKWDRFSEKAAGFCETASLALPICAAITIALVLIFNSA